ncbi:MAG TPA: hypothetical protein VG847_06060 [Chitinophagaceae bacterium]|nr:hypothetical protein [Chitinophagaceae bacterium]
MIEMNGPIAFLIQSQSAVYFSKANNNAGVSSGIEGTAMPIRKLQNVLGVAFWGEDNRFPQNIEQQMAYCGVGKQALNWKAQILYGNGILPGKITGFKDDGSEIFTPLDRDKEKAIYALIEQRSMFRFFLEYGLDWVWYYNTFPEVIFSNDCKSITGFVHQESCDARFKQMDKDGNFNTVFLSKLWGASKDQYAIFDPTKAVKGLLENPNGVDVIPQEFIKTLDAIDMYNAVNSAKEIAERKKKTKGLKSAILPVNFPSVNKTYYQLPAWDGARLAGWVEIASKIPSMLKTLYQKAFKLRYHIEIPENFFERKYGYEIWKKMTEAEQTNKRKDLLEQMDEFLSGDENAFASFISFFEINIIDKTEYGRIKISEIPDTSKIDKEMLSMTAAELELLISMGIPPNIFGAGTVGTGQMRSGGSDLREAFLIYIASLNLERQVFLEPLYLMRDFNGWDSDIIFRHRDTILTTLDTGSGTKKTLS